MKKLLIFAHLLITFYQFGQSMMIAEYSHTDNNDFSCKSYLYANEKECVYKIGDTRPSGEINTRDGSVGFINNDEISEFFFTNINKSYHRFLNSNLEWFYSDDLTQKLNWNIDNSIKKKIGRYNCTQAKLKINGRNYTVWFSYDLPFKFGPLKLHNLPGLVVEVIEDNQYLKISLTNFYKTKKTTDFFKLKNYALSKKRVSNYSEYENDVTKFQVGSKTKSFAALKLAKIEEGPGFQYLNEVVVDNYLDIPIDLLEKLKKVR